MNVTLENTKIGDTLLYKNIKPRKGEDDEYTVTVIKISEQTITVSVAGVSPAGGKYADMEFIGFLSLTHVNENLRTNK